MKPISLCLVQMGNKGLELVKAHPNALPKEILNQITIKSMPLGAKDGDFTSNTIGETVFSGYVFSLPTREGRDNIASLVAVYDNMRYDREAIRKLFSFTITELRKHNLVELQTIEKILPKLYTGLIEGHVKVKISSVVTLEFDFKREEEIDKDQEALNGFKKDAWK